MSQTIAYVLRSGSSRQRRSLIRPPHLREIYYGFILRIFIGLASAIAPLCGLTIIGLFNGWRLTTPMLVFFGVTVFVTILFGEHVRSRAYERTASTRRQREESESEIEPLVLVKKKSYGFRSLIFQRWLKRGLDVLLAVVAIILLLPAFIVYTVLIKLDSSGPVLIKLKRIGRGGKTITLIRFRTMEDFEPSAPAPASRIDARETRLGRWLKLSGQDKLPALLSVLTGTMSFVGPRPLSVEQADNLLREFPHEAKYLLGVRPGLIGVGPTRTTESKRAIRLVTKYLDNWSLGLDFAILINAMTSIWRRA